MADHDSSIERYLAELAAAQTRTQAQIEALVIHMGRVEAQIEALVIRVDRVEAQIEALVIRVDRVEAQIEQLVEAVYRLTDLLGKQGDQIAKMRGTLLETEYREKAPAYFGRMIRRTHVLSHEDLDGLLEGAVERKLLTADERQDLMWVDLVVRGKREEADLYLAVEVSASIDAHDVERAARRAKALAKVVGEALPVVAGEGIAEGTNREAARMGVWQLLDGRLLEPAP